MKRDKRYKATEKRLRGLNGTRFGPLLRVLACVTLLVLAAGLFYHVGLPLMRSMENVSPEVSCFLVEAEPTPVPTPAPTLAPGSAHALYGADLAEIQKEIVAGEFQYMADPAVCGDRIVLAAGNYSDLSGVAVFVRILARDARTGENTVYTVPQRYETIRYPHVAGEYLVYLDCHATGGGRIVSYHTGTQELRVLKTVYAGIPRLFVDGTTAVWTERTGETRDKVFACDIATGELATLAILDNSAFGESMPYIGGGYITYLDANGALKVLHIASGETRTLQVGGAPHDPKTNGSYVAYMTGNHAQGTELYCFAVITPDPMLVATDVVDYYIGDQFLAYSRGEKNYVYFFSDQTTFQVTRDGEKSLLLTAGGNYLAWIDVTWRDKDIMEYMPVSGWEQ